MRIKALFLLFIMGTLDTFCESEKHNKGSFHLDVKDSLKNVDPKKQNAMIWEKSTEKSESLFTLENERSQIECTKNGTIKVELTMTVLVTDNPSNVLLCVNHLNQAKQRTEQECQQFKYLKSQAGYVTSIQLNCIYNVIECDKIHVTVVGTDMINRYRVFNRLLMYYI